MGGNPQKAFYAEVIFLLISAVLMFIKSWVCIGVLHFGLAGVYSFIDIPVVLLAAGLFSGADALVKTMKKKA